MIRRVFLWNRRNVKRATINCLTFLRRQRRAIANASLTVANNARAKSVARFRRPASRFVRHPTIKGIGLHKAFILYFFRSVATRAHPQAAARLEGARFRGPNAAKHTLANERGRAHVESDGPGRNRGLVGRFVKRAILRIQYICVVDQAGSQRASNIKARARAYLRVLNIRRRASGIMAVNLRSRGCPSTRVISATLRNAIRHLHIMNVIIFKSHKVRFFMIHPIVNLLRGSVYTSSHFLRRAMVLRYNDNGVSVRPPSNAVTVLSKVSNASTLRCVFCQVITQIFPRFRDRTFIPRILRNRRLTPSFFLHRFLTKGVLIANVVEAMGAAICAVIKGVGQDRRRSAVTVGALLSIPHRYGSLLHRIVLIKDRRCHHLAVNRPLTLTYLFR